MDDGSHSTAFAECTGEVRRITMLNHHDVIFICQMAFIKTLRKRIRFAVNEDMWRFYLVTKTSEIYYFKVSFSVSSLNRFRWHLSSSYLKMIT
jgi:hypothetical protein